MKKISKVKAFTHEFKHFMGIKFVSSYEFVSIIEIKDHNEFHGTIIAEYKTQCIECGKIGKEFKYFNYDTVSGLKRIEEIKKGSEFDNFEFKYCDKELKVIKIEKENKEQNRYDFIQSRSMEETMEYIFNFKGPE